MATIHDEKKYVAVSVIHFPTGQCLPTVMEVDGKPYVIQRIFENKRVPSKYQFDAMEYFAVEVNGKERFLFRNGQRWFIIPGLIRNKQQTARR